MIFHAIGKPGQPVEKYVTNPLVTVLDPLSVIIEVGDLPSIEQMISADGTSVVPYQMPLDLAKEVKSRDAMAYRNACQEGTCATPLGVVQIDADSQRKIAGAALAALIAKGAGQAFSVDWTMTDNSVVTHNADAMIAMGITVTTYIAECQYACTAVKASVSSAIDQATLDGLNITAGYPA